MAEDLKRKLTSVKPDISTSEAILGKETVWELCHISAFRIKELENKISLMENSFKAEIVASLDSEEDYEWNQWGKEMIDLMGYGNDDLGYRTGEGERIALSVANSDLRSEVRMLREENSNLKNAIRLMCDLIHENFPKTAISIASDALSQVGEEL